MRPRRLSVLLAMFLCLLISRTAVSWQQTMTATIANAGTVSNVADIVLLDEATTSVTITGAWSGTLNVSSTTNNISWSNNQVTDASGNLITDITQNGRYGIVPITNARQVRIKPASSLAIGTARIQFSGVLSGGSSGGGGGGGVVQIDQTGTNNAVQFVDAANAAFGTSGNPVRTDPTGNTAQPVTVAGGATAANQVPPGPAGTPNANVQSIQGIAGMVAVKVDASGTPNQGPASGANASSTVYETGGDAFAPSQVSVGTTATLILAARTARKIACVKIGATASQRVFLGGSGVTTGTGVSIPAIADAGHCFPTNAAIYGIVATSTQTVEADEEY